MCLNRTSEWNVMAIWISWQLSFFNFERLDISWASIVHPCQKLWTFEFALFFHVLFQASRYIMLLNRTSMWKVMTIWISQELPLFNFKLLDIWCARIGHPYENLWPFEFRESFRCLISSVSIYYKSESDLSVKSYDHLNFSRASVVQFRASRHIMCPNRTSVWKVMTIWISRELPFSICNVSIYYRTQWDIRV